MKSTDSLPSDKICLKIESFFFGFLLPSNRVKLLVVGGLLPIVSKDSNGLVSRSNYQSFPKNYSINGNKYAKIIQHSTMGAWNVTFIDIFAVRGLGGNPGRIIVAISSDSS